VIKRAAAAGAVAWTAPLIIDSLASPAAAATVAPGCYRAYFPNASACAAATPSDTGVCEPTGWDGKATVPAGVISGSSSCTNSVNPTFTIASGVSCVFVQGGAQQTSGGGTCVYFAGGGKTLTFTRTGNWAGQGFRMLISCGGVAC
jgi:hypothetical protein